MASDGPLTVIILAAGQSQRMGARNKLTLDAGGRPVIARVVDAFVGVSDMDLIVVTGADRDRVQDAIVHDEAVRFVHNAAYASGMASSIRAGVRAARPETTGYAMSPGDLPLLRAATIQHLVRVFKAQPIPCIVQPVHEGQPGHPVLFDRSFREQLLQLQGDRGAREVIQQHQHAVERVDVLDGGVVRDVDTPDALRAVRGDLSRRT